MSSRSTILNAVRAAQGAAPFSHLPEISFQAPPSLDDFIATLDMIGARVVRGTLLDEAKTWLQANVPTGVPIASTFTGIPGTVDLQGVADPHHLDGVHTAVLGAQFGVCENGAVWMDEAELGPHRVLPFIAEHLFIVLKAADLVANMHEAYTRIGKIGTGFGLFLAGPSKTADIEQCLVIGAHGARGATLFVLG